LTGTVNLTVLGRIGVPGGRMGPHGLLRVTTFWSMTNNANNKTPSITFQNVGGGGAVGYVNQAIASVISLNHQLYISNRAAENSQLGQSNSTLTYGGSGGTIITSAVDTSQDSELVLAGQLANAGDSLTFERYLVELIAGRPASR